MLGLGELIGILVVFGIPFAIFVTLVSFTIRAVRVSNARHARIVGQLERIEADLFALRRELLPRPPSDSSQHPPPDH